MKVSLVKIESLLFMIASGNLCGLGRLEREIHNFEESNDQGNGFGRMKVTYQVVSRVLSFKQNSTTLETIVSFTRNKVKKTEQR
jgi:hypothetical protein